uniref:Uncharacterized protein n=1 Tax=Trichuris muris TaxID=70415 RepID=A0A5S6Q729_TRIMR
MSAVRCRGRAKSSQKGFASKVKRTAGRTRKAETVGDAVKALRKEVESLRLELTKSSQITRSDESSWQTAKEQTVAIHQVSRTLGGRSSGGTDVLKLPDDSERTVCSKRLDASVGPEELTLSNRSYGNVQRRSLGDVFGGGNDHWISYADRGPNPSGSNHCVPSVDPVQCIEPFDGDPRKWDMFIGSFRALVHDVMPSDAIRIAYLRMLLSPQVRGSIASYLHSPELYQDALKDLKYRYGDRRLIAQCSLKALRGMEPLKREDLKELDRFSCELHDIICSLVKSGSM